MRGRHETQVRHCGYSRPPRQSAWSCALEPTPASLYAREIGSALSPRWLRGIVRRRTFLKQSPPPLEVQTRPPARQMRKHALPAFPGPHSGVRAPQRTDTSFNHQVDYFVIRVTRNAAEPGVSAASPRRRISLPLYLAASVPQGRLTAGAFAFDRRMRLRQRRAGADLNPLELAP